MPARRAGGEQERLQRYLARAGLGSRRSCEKLILEGMVRVNGRVVTELGTKVSPGLDKVRYDGNPVAPSDRLVYLILNKPAGVLTSLSDPRGRPVIRDLLPSQGLPRVFPVGRLDYQTEGLVLLTNDGALAHGVMHPSFEVEKEYRVKVRGCPTPTDLAKLKAGVVSEGEKLWAVRARMTSPGTGSAWLSIVVRQGRYHEIRRLCDAIGYPALQLQRIRLGPIVLGRLPKGCWRKLSSAELADIRRACLSGARKQPLGSRREHKSEARVGGRPGANRRTE